MMIRSVRRGASFYQVSEVGKIRSIEEELKPIAWGGGLPDRVQVVYRGYDEMRKRIFEIEAGGGVEILYATKD